MKTGANLKNRQGGAVAIIVALSLFVLVGMIGLVLDLGRLYIIKTELQNVADACALAAARELNGDANSLTRAENAGITVGGRNRVDFQSGLVNIQSGDITFSVTLDGSYVPSASVSNIANVKYVKCTLPLGGIQPWFMAALGAGQQVVSSMAVATLAPSQTNCAVPLGLCLPDSGPYIEGKWYSGVYSAGTGSYDWVDFSPSEGGGASELKDLLAGAGQCDLPSAGTPVGEQGQIVGLTDAWNSRFGIYKGGGQYNQTTAPPDFTGYAYTASTWPEPEPQNAYSGSSSIGAPNYQAAKSASLPYQASNPVDLHGYPLPTNTDYSKGSDRRLAVVPIVNCALLALPGITTPVIAYACVFLLSPINGPNDIVLEFRSLGDCASSGLGGGTVGPLVPVLVQ